MSGAYGLLLLPEPPQYPNFSNIQLALRPAISMAFKKLRDCSVSHFQGASEPRSAILDIALPISRLATGSTTDEDLFVSIQQLLTSVLTLLATIHHRENITKNGLEGVHSRIILVHGQTEDEINASIQRRLSLCSVPFMNLACSRKAWTNIFVVEGGPGEKLYRYFRRLIDQTSPLALGPTWQVDRLQGGVQLFHAAKGRDPRIDVGMDESLHSNTHGVDHDIWVVVDGGELSLGDRCVLALGLTLIQVPQPSADGTIESLQQGTLHIACVRAEDTSGCNGTQSICQTPLVKYLLGTNNLNLTNSAPTHSTQEIDGNSVCTVSIVKQGLWLRWSIYPIKLLTGHLSMPQPTTILVSCENKSMVQEMLHEGQESTSEAIEVREIGSIKPVNDTGDEL